MKQITTGIKAQQQIRANVLAAEANSEKAFTLRAFIVITVLFLLAWVLTG